MMAKVSLGQLRIHSKSSGLELKLTSSIKCAAAGEAEVEQLRETLTASELNENSSPRPFIYCDNSLLFSLLLQFDPELDSEEHDCLIQEFPAKLRTATLWRHLHFAQPAICTSIPEAGKIDIELTLNREVKASEQGLQPQHKLGVDVPFSDMKAPPGILTATLESVFLDVVIRHRFRSEQDRLRTNEAEAPLKEDHELESEMLLDAECWSHNFCNTEDMPDDDASIYGAGAIDGPFLETDSENEAATNPDSDMLLGLENANSLRHHELLHLLDAAVRRAISKLGVLAKSISVEGDNSIKPLSSIAPAVFRSRYLPAIASRAVLLPTLAQSIKAVSSRRFAPKLTRIAILSTHRNINEPDQPDSTTKNDNERQLCTQEQKRHLPARLWTTLERGLLNSMTERRLKPFLDEAEVSHSFDFDSQLLETMDESQGTEQNVHTSDLAFDFGDDYGSERDSIEFDEVNWSIGENASDFEHSDVHLLEDGLSRGDWSLFDDHQTGGKSEQYCDQDNSPVIGNMSWSTAPNATAGDTVKEEYMSCYRTGKES